MNWLVRFAAGVWDFIVGDDWTIALGIAVSIGVTAAVAALSLAAWWVMPVCVPVVLLISLRRERRRVGG